MVVGGVGVDGGGDGVFHGICRNLFVPCILPPFFTYFLDVGFIHPKVCLPRAKY